MKEFLKTLAEGSRLTHQQAREAMQVIMTGGATDAQIGAYLMLLRTGDGPTIDEISGSAEAMRAAAVGIELTDAQRDAAVDLVGTGGSGLNPFNISTAACFVVAASGVPVAKHGNRGVSSTSGSADVLTALGVDIAAPPECVARCVRELGIGYLFAPSMHPAMKYAIGPRREIGLRTIFNILGPLTNPAGVRRQVLGVFDESLIDPMAQSLVKLGSIRAMVVRGDDGLDELTTTTTTQVAYVHDGKVSRDVVDPESLGLQPVDIKQLQTDGPETSAGIVRDVLSGQRGPQADVVALNAAAGLLVAGKVDDLADGLALARQTIDSGKPLETLENLVLASRGESSS